MVNVETISIYGKDAHSIDLQKNYYLSCGGYFDCLSTST
jgi:hypothetical protein